MSSFTIRPGQVADLEFLYECVADLQLLEQPDVALNDVNRREINENNEDQINLGTLFVAVDDANGERAGFVSYITTDKVCCMPCVSERWWNMYDFLSYVYVRKPYRRHGVGSMLMERFLKESTQAVVYLDIFENNPTAQKFFSKFGARREMHVSERFMPSSSAMSTASNSITFRRYNDSTDRLLIRNGLRAIFEAEGVDIARLYIPFEQQDIDDFDKDYGGTTLCAIDDNQPVGFLTFMRTNQCPFGVDYGQYNDGEDYLFLSYLYVAKSHARRGIGTALANEVMRRNADLRWVRSSHIAVNETAAKWHAANGFKTFVSIWRIDNVK